MKAQELASFIECEIFGDSLKEITKTGYLFTAKEDELVYCYMKSDEKDLETIQKSNAGILICSRHLKDRLVGKRVRPTLILSETPKYDFARILQEFFVSETPKVSPLAYLDSNIKLGNGVDIHPNVTVYDNVEIGNRVTVRAGAVLGGEGLDYGKNTNGKLKRIPHMSSLIIEDDVDIGCNTTVQKGILRPTIIGEGTKIGPNCDIGHEARLGKHCIITGMTIIAGATSIGNYTFIAPHSTICNSIKIGSNVFVGIGSLVLNDVPDNTTVVGRPAIEISKFRKQRQRLMEIVEDSS